MPLDEAAIARRLRRRRSGAPTSSAGASSTASRRRWTPVRRSPSAARRRRPSSARSRPRPARRSGSPSRTSARTPAGRTNARDAGPKMAALLAAAAEPARAVQFVAMESQGVALVYGRDETAIEAARQLADHLDITVLLTKPGEIAPPRATEFPVLKGTIAGATGHLGAFELRDRRLRAAGALLARASRLRPGARRRDLDLRPHPRPVGQFPALSGARAALAAICAPTRATPRPSSALIFEASHLVGDLRQAAIRQLLRELVRPFALADHRLHALPRALPDGRHHAGRRPCRDRPLRLRRLRLLRRRLPDRRRRPTRCRMSAASCAACGRSSRRYRAAGRRAIRSSCSTTAAMASR